MFELFEHQKPPLKAVNTAFKTQDRALMVMASGLGKTVLAAFFAKDYIQNGRMLFLCHENEILAQALSIFRQVLGEAVSLGVFTGQQKDYEEVDILFASFQTFREWKQAFFPDEFATIIVDESHHGQAPTYKEVIDYFTPQKLFGMTATPDRMDEKDIREIFGEEVVNLTLEEGIAKGWLTPVEYHVMTDDLNKKALNQILKDVLEKGQRVSIKQLNETIFIKARDEEIARIIQSYDRKTIIFCERIEHAEEFIQFLPRAECFHSGRTAYHNEQVLKAFRDGTLQYILAVDKFNEGIDIPDAEMVVFLRCTDSRIVFLQQLGRGLRKIKGKDKVVVLDFVANCHRLIAVRDMVGRVKSIANGQALCEDVLKVTGKAFDFLFTDEQQDIFKILEAIQPRYVSDIPHLLAEYSDKNELPPDQVIAGTAKKLWWKCQKEGCGYEWQVTGNSRMSKGSGCAACANKVVTDKNNLTVTHPKLAKEYSDRNELPACEVLASTESRLWWKCQTCNYEWQTSGSNRTRGTGCPSCANKVVSNTNNLAVTHPELLKEYSDKNELPACKVIAGTSKRLWWKCIRCNHEWQTTGNNRIKGSGCPACANRVATDKNNLAVTHPELAKEYSDRNELSASEVIASTDSKLWWKCQKCNHEWQAVGKSRAKGSGCPACANKVATDINNLAVTHPELTKEYSDKNELPAHQVVAGTQKKLWWKCRICNHEWQAGGCFRARGAGCPACTNQVVTDRNNLAVTHPELAKEYSSKNELPPDQVIAGTNKKLWWKCNKCNYEWQTTGNSRVVRGQGCPACSGRVPTTTNNLAVTHPELAKEYSDRNKLPAHKVIAGTGKKLWWKCKTCNNEWQATGDSRVRGNGCSVCSIKRRNEKRKLKFYRTWQEASKASISLGIYNWHQYRKMYKQNSRLPSTPQKFYNDFPKMENGRPDWDLFFGRKK